MKLSGSAIGRAIDRPDPATRFYLFYGPDDAGSRHLATRLLNSLAAEKFTVHAATIKTDPAQLADEASATALFGGPRAIWIEPAGDEITDGVASLLDAASVESPVIAIGGALRKTSGLVKLAEAHGQAAAVISYIPEGRDADQMVIAAGRAEGLRSRATSLRGWRSIATATRRSWLRKWPSSRSSSTPAPTVARSHSRRGRFARRGFVGRESDAARRSCACRRRARAIGRNRRASIAPNEAIPVVRALQRRLLQLAPLRARVERGERVDGVLTSMGKALFWKDKPLMQRLLTNWNAERIAQAMERSAALERAAILSDEPPVAALGEELVTIARGGRRA